MRTRSRIVGELNGNWAVGDVESGHQEDTHNCGPFVLMVCQSFIKLS